MSNPDFEMYVKVVRTSKKAVQVRINEPKLEEADRTKWIPLSLVRTEDGDQPDQDDLTVGEEILIYVPHWWVKEEGIDE